MTPESAAALAPLRAKPLAAGGPDRELSSLNLQLPLFSQNPQHNAVVHLFISLTFRHRVTPGQGRCYDGSSGEGSGAVRRFLQVLSSVQLKPPSQ